MRNSARTLSDSLGWHPHHQLWLFQATRIVDPEPKYIIASSSQVDIYYVVTNNSSIALQVKI